MSARDEERDDELALRQVRAGDRPVLRGRSYGLAVRDEIPERTQRLGAEEGHEALVRQVLDDEPDGNVFRDLSMDLHRREAT